MQMDWEEEGRNTVLPERSIDCTIDTKSLEKERERDRQEDEKDSERKTAKTTHGGIGSQRLALMRQYGKQDTGAIC